LIGVLLEKIKSLLLQLGNDSVIKETDYGSLSLPVLVMLGDRDKMVSLEETVNVYKNIPKAQLCILPGTPHPIEQSDMPVLASFIRRFCV
jgi:pimeloyl-ACP methyl ester carboxylesterase